jgi:5'-methylthioadenosine phosphorylase
MWAIIGGSGFEKFDEFKTIEPLDTNTPFGKASSGLRRVRLGDKDCIFLSRHGDHHELLPSEINYRANIFALKKYGVKAILSFSAVGSLREQFKPGDLVVPSQYIDRTKGIRASTFCGEGLVGHMSLAKPVHSNLINKVRELAPSFSWDSHFGKTYICIEGPNFSTQAESNSYRAMGAEIIGMTNFPEYSLAREAGISYLPCCFVTDYDCWDDTRPHVTIDEVVQVMRKNNSKAFTLAQKILNLSSPAYENCDCSEHGLKFGLLTSKEMIPESKKAWLEVLTK